jgi:flagellar motor switch protein FliM
MTHAEIAPLRARPQPYDFRSQGRLQPGLLAQVEEIHKKFAASLTERLSQELRRAVDIETLAIDRLVFDAYLRALPNPNLLTILTLPPLEGQVVLEVSPQLALALVDILLGGPGRPIAPRPPTELEMTLIGHVLEHFVSAIAAGFEDISEAARVIGSETNPAFLQAASPREAMVLVSLSVVVDGPIPSSGLVGICYPMDLLTRMGESRQRPDPVPGTPPPPPEGLLDAPVQVCIRTAATPFRAGELVSLRPGDVVALDQLESDPLLVMIEDVAAMTAHLGRRRDRMGVRVAGWLR